MSLKAVALAALLYGVSGPAARPAPVESDDAAQLQHQTQELLDAITTGSANVWERYLDSAASFTTEDGKVRSKREMVADVRPLPKTISGDIKVTEFTVALHGNVAVTTHLDDEHEVFHGQRLHCQYRTTDTWLRTPAGWRLIGSQILAVRTDPPAITLPPAQLDDYVGRYTLAPDLSYEIRRDGPVLIGQETGRKADTIRVEARDVLFVPGQPRYRKVFRRDAHGDVVGFAERREAWDLTWTRSR
jgi:Domain of unknown function (DUF4440)